MKTRLAILAIILLPLAANAQGGPVPRGSGIGGISVQGTGSVRIPVKTVQVAAQVRGVIDEPGALAALRAAGVEDPVFGTNGPRIGSNTQLFVRGAIRAVTRAKLDHIGEAAVAYMAAHTGTTIDNVMFSARLEDCAQPEQTARAAALADARRKADAIAVLAGVSIDGVATVNENGGCPATGESGYGGQGQLDLGALVPRALIVARATPR